MRKQYKQNSRGKKRAAVIAAASLAVLTAGVWLPAYADTKETAETEEETYKTAQQSDVSETDSEKRSMHTVSSGDRPDKSETVYVKADADGTVQKVTVEDVLKNPGGSEKISDVSDLTEIKNTEGDEEFTQEKDGSILWENKGEDITYEGESDADLPVNVSVQYFLDGKEMKADKIAGQSGTVTIRFTYENQSDQTVTEDGKEQQVITPFAAVTAVMLPEENFSDVQVTNGKLVEMDGQTIVLGYAFPGWEDALGLDSYEVTEEVDLPEYVEIQAEAENFTLDFTATVVTNGFFADLADEDLADADDLTASMEEFSDASGQLLDGVDELLQGSSTLQTYMQQYNEGVKTVDSGAAALNGGTAALKDNTAALKDGAAALSGGLAALQDALSDDTLSGIAEAGEQITAYTEGVQQAVTTARASLKEADPKAAKEQAQSLAKEQAKAAALESLADVEGLSEEEKNVLAEEIADAIDLSGVTAETEANVAAADAALAQIPAVDSSELLARFAQTATLAESIRQLSEGSIALQSGLEQFESGIAQLSDGVTALAQGTSQLSEAGDELYEGCAALTEGIKALRDGFAAFDEDGVQRIADLAGDDLEHVISQVKLLRAADRQYQTFSGLPEGKSGSVKFMIETEAID